jgi:tetratricopeptide (TPR) repeat protein
LAHAFHLKGERDAAIRAYRKAIEIGPEDPAAHNNLALILVEEKGSREEALRLAEKALQLRPDDGRILDTVGWVHYMLGNLFEAERQLRAASNLLPAEAAIQYHLGLVAKKQGRRVEASTALKRALLLNPNFEGADNARKLIGEMEG